jgi:hypothetical protein
METVVLNENRDSEALNRADHEQALNFPMAFPKKQARQ